MDLVPAKEFNFIDVITEYFPELYLDNYSNKEKIEIIEWAMFQQFENIADELPVREWVHGGMYTRELTIPFDTLLTGKIHTQDHVFFLNEGELLVLTDDGLKRLKAPATFMAKAGSKKVGYAYTDCICTTVNVTNCTTVEDAENESLLDSDLQWVDDLYNEQVKICQAQE
jgi:hypothetical protein